MAGSLNHMVAKDGSFRFSLIENLGDAYEACEECFDIIAELAGGDLDKLNAVLRKLGYPVVKAAPRVGARFEEDEL